MDFISKKFDELTTTELYEILKSRAEIFLLEQRIICQDLDDIDYKSLHCFLYDEQRVVAYLRAFLNEENTGEVMIGRVLSLEHKKGLGTELVKRSMNEIKSCFACKKIKVHAQTHAVGFYEKFGFEVVSDTFLEECVPHVTMELSL